MVRVTLLYLLIFTLAIIFQENVFPLTHSNSPEKRISLASEWKVKFDDNKEYSLPGYDDSQWETCTLPGKIASIITDKYNGKIDGIAWIRKTVYIGNDLRGREGIGLILGRIASADETYFNGVRIGGMGKFPPDGFSMWNHPRHYYIPDVAVRYGANNVISIRIYGHVFFEVLGTLAITHFDDWLSDRTLENFFIITINYIIIFIYFSLLVMFALVYIRRREEEYLYYCLQLVFGILVILEICGYWNFYSNNLIRLKLLLFSWVAINIFHPIFLHRIYELKRKKTEIMLFCYMAFVAIVLVMMKGKISELPLALIMIILTTCIGVYNIFCHISALRKKRPYAKRFSLFGIIIIITAIHDGIVYLLKFNPNYFRGLGPAFEIMMIGYGSIAFFIGTALLMIHRYINILDDNEDLVKNLENFFMKNSMLRKEMSDLKEKYSFNLTEQLVGKIRKAVEYVECNYRSDISREGLAASIDLHPDNLGRMFYKYTGKKIGGYINELRIRDAAKQLIETDTSIPDISLAVGFENFRTFNRLFPKYMKTTPHSYRKKYSRKMMQNDPPSQINC